MRKASSGRQEKQGQQADFLRGPIHHELNIDSMSSVQDGTPEFRDSRLQNRVFRQAHCSH